MQFATTRHPQSRVGLSQALSQGLAADGGLFVPIEWPAFAVADLETPANSAVLAPLAEAVLQPFASGDPLQRVLTDICNEAFNFPAPQFWLDDAERLGVLELFHGPTAAFKDFGARFLAAALARLAPQSGRPLHVLVATSGDTGGAVAAAFHRRPGVQVSVLYPKRMVKQAFADQALRARFELTSANSINLGRLLPQTCYYWAASLRVQREQGEPVSFVVPSGNLGNATACAWARQMGAPIGEILLAHNINRTVPDYLHDGVLRPRASVPTISNAMDVGDPSNLERLTALYPSLPALRAALDAVWVDDEATRARIRTDFARYGRIWCPHTAVAAEAHARLDASRRTGSRWLLVATAHPAKFRETVAPLIGESVPMPENLSRLFDRPSSATEIEPDIEALRHAL